MKSIGLVTGLVLFSLNAHVASAQALPHPSIDAFNDFKTTTTLISVEERAVSPEEEMLLSDSLFLDPPPVATVSPQGAGIDPMAIADIAFKIWDIIKENKPVVNVQYKNVNALPNIADRKWETLTGWKTERTMMFNISTVNGFGTKTVDLDYKVALLYGGGYRGKGQFIASARVVPTKVDVLWGYNLDVSVEVPYIVNIASSEDPLASISLDVKYQISTILRSYSETNTYELHGDGLMKADGAVVYAASRR